MAQKRRSLFILPLIVLVFSILGGFYGPRVQVAAAASDAEAISYHKEMESFTKALALVEQNFAEPVDNDKAIYRGAIPGDVGKYYLQTKNWKAAQSRFDSAMILDPENPEVYWGLAETERHLGKFAEARAHYMKLLDYDPEGPHGKEARKALKEPEIANAASPAAGLRRSGGALWTPFDSARDRL